MSKELAQLRSNLTHLMSQWRQTARFIRSIHSDGAVAYEECCNELSKIMAGNLSPIELLTGGYPAIALDTPTERTATISHELDGQDGTTSDKPAKRPQDATQGGQV